MDLVGLAAIIGAAAWLPQIGRWLYKYVSKPQLEILSAPSLAVSYTAGGPVVEWATSVSTQRQDALITKIILRVTHEKGESRMLTWSRVSELFSEVTGLAGEHAEFRRPQSVLAIKVATETLTERTITFYDKEFFFSADETVAAVKDQYNYLKSEGGDAEEAILKAKEFKQSLDFFTKEPFWREGKYKFDLYLFEKHLKKPYHQGFGVYVTKDHLERLRLNREAFDSYLKMTVLGQEVKPNWQWVFPTIIPLTD
jgi:hypothetical protein